jgi:AcrR family transcriptional regulator
MTCGVKMAKNGEKDTKRLILNAAEKLFANDGFSATSLRQITTAADVNLAAVNYHFGSKESLIDAVISRRLDPMNRERLGLLDRLEAEAGEQGPALEAIVEAFIGPPLRMQQTTGSKGSNFMRLLGRVMNDPSDRALNRFIDQFRETIERFSAALSRALPDLSPAEILWRMVFMVGAMAHTMSISRQLPRVTGGLCDPSDVGALIKSMTPFLAAGMRADAPGGDA